MTNFIRDNKGKRFHPENPPLNDKKEIASCARKLSFVKILETTLHEMLHGVGKRHIFSASADKDNYYKTYKEIRDIFGDLVPTDEKTASYSYPPQFSSQMDYPNFLFPVLPVPGKLDIAALRFIYFDKVELVKGGFLDVPAGADRDPEKPQKSILDTIRAKGLTKKDIKAYNVCGGKKWDEGIDSEFDLDDPLCDSFDYGKTPLEVVKNAITVTTSFLLIGRNRYDSEIVAHELFEIGAAMAELINSIYSKWVIDYKDALLKSIGKTIGDYSFLNAEHIAEYKNLLEEEAKKNPDFNEYYLIREPVFDYVMRMAFVPVKHCVYKMEDDSYKAMALENIEEKILKDYAVNSRVEFMDCKSSPAEKWAEANVKGELIAEVGFFGKDRKYFIRPKTDDPVDEQSPFANNPIFAKLMPELSDQITLSFWSSVVINSNSIMQAPDFASRYYKEMSEYVFKGIDLNPYIDGALNLQSDSIPRDLKGKPQLPRFFSYKIDTQTSGTGGKGGLYEGRQSNIDYLVTTLKPEITNEKIKYQFNKAFFYYILPFLDISRLAEEEIRRPGFYQDVHPFLSEAYEEYEKVQMEDKDFIAFLKNHPALVHFNENNRILIPFSADKSSFIGKVSRRYSTYMKCIEADSADTPCENIEEKKAFTKALIDVYF